LVGFKNQMQELEAVKASVLAVSVDAIDKAGEVAAEVGFPVAYGATRDMADKIGAFWEDRRSIIQPSEFVLSADSKIIVSSYSDGPLGRIDAADVVKLIKFYESRK
jgi:peroxiredoxin